MIKSYIVFVFVLIAKVKLKKFAQTNLMYLLLESPRTSPTITTTILATTPPPKSKSQSLPPPLQSQATISSTNIQKSTTTTKKSPTSSTTTTTATPSAKRSNGGHVGTIVGKSPTKPIRSKQKISKQQQQTLGSTTTTTTTTTCVQMQTLNTTELGTTESSFNSMVGKFTIGELIWGPSHGYPAWPGKIIKKSETNSNVHVQWFGGGGRATSELIAVNSLQSLSEGLEAHHKAQKDTRK